VHGRHTFKTGYEVLRHRLNSSQINIPSGSYVFSDMTAGLQPSGNPMPRTGSALAGFLLGAVRQASFDSQLTSWLPRSIVHGIYFQDDWKVSNTLTLNLGLRYTNESPFNTKYGQMSNFDPTAVDDVSPGSIGAIVHPTEPLNRRDNNNLQPRIGMAWQPLPKWVFRAGFALSTVDVRYPTVRGQFEEYVASAVVQRPPGDPRPAFYLSEGPGDIGYRIRPNGTSGFLGSNFTTRIATGGIRTFATPMS
jgi:hypothetical protein